MNERAHTHTHTRAYRTERVRLWDHMIYHQESCTTLLGNLDQETFVVSDLFLLQTHLYDKQTSLPKTELISPPPPLSFLSLFSLTAVCDLSLDVWTFTSLPPEMETTALVIPNPGWHFTGQQQTAHNGAASHRHLYKTSSGWRTALCCRCQNGDSHILNLFRLRCTCCVCLTAYSLQTQIYTLI